jgi:hypothetical protein
MSYELDDRESIPVTSSGIFPFINNKRLLVSYNIQIKKKIMLYIDTQASVVSDP